MITRLKIDNPLSLQVKIQERHKPLIRKKAIKWGFFWGGTVSTKKYTYIMLLKRN